VNSLSTAKKGSPTSDGPFLWVGSACCHEFSLLRQPKTINPSRAPFSAARFASKIFRKDAKQNDRRWARYVGYFQTQIVSAQCDDGSTKSASTRVVLTIGVVIIMTVLIVWL
jgi:hypothetical protein